MTHTDSFNESTVSNWRLFEPVFNSTAIVIAIVTKRWRIVATRRAIAGLTDAQLDDIGHPQAPLSRLEIKAGVITNLMSLR